MQIKVFIGREDEISKFEAEVNGWLKSSGAKVVNVIGNIAPQAILNRPDAKPLTAESGMRRFAPSDLFVCFMYE